MKFWKKTSALGLATVMVFSSLPPVLANDQPSKLMTEPVEKQVNNEKEAANAKVKKEQAIEIARKYVTIPAGFEVRSVNYSSNHYMTGRGVWDIFFEKSDTEKRNYGSIYVSVDADKGQILSFHIHDQANQPSYPPKVDFQEAKEVANKYLEQQHPNLKGSLKYNEYNESNFKTPLHGDVRYVFQYDRVHQGVVFPHNNVSITIDGNGKVVGYSFSWSDSITFESQDKLITKEEATKKFMEGLDLPLSYKLPWGQRINQKPQVFIAYQYPYSLFGISGKTGEFIQYNGKPYVVQTKFEPLTEKPLAEKPKGNKNLTQDQALKIITSTFELPAKAELQNAYFEESNYDTPWGKRSVWSFSWRVGDENGKDSQYIWANVDSNTGEVLNFSQDDYRMMNEGKAPAVSIEEAKKAAIEWAKKLVPHYTDQIYVNTSHLDNATEEELKKIYEYHFSFQRVVNGIPSEIDSLSISINPQTGKLARYYNSFGSVEYPSKQDLISLEKARELYLAQYNVELRYTLMNEYELYQTKSTEKKEAQLVYQLIPKNMMEPVFLDAKTGKWTNQETGEETDFERVVATDIKGHWAEKQLQLMIDYKALDVKDGKANPNQTITRGEMIKMLIISMNGGYYRPYYGLERAATFKDVSNQSKYFAYVEAAVDRNLINRGEIFNPDAPITRDEIAELIVRALGYNELAKNHQIFALNIKDAKNVKNKGQVAIVLGLGIMSADKAQQFNPSRQVTRAEAAMSFYRYLEKRAGLNEQQPGYPIYH